MSYAKLYSNRKSFFKGLIIFSTVFSLFFVSCKSADVNKESETPLVLDSKIKQGSFENGMTYYILHNEEPKNRIILRLVVKAGSCMEEDDQKGIAHFIEHLAFNGTEHFEKSAIVDYFEKIGMNFGADLNAYTSFEETVYMLEVPADDPQMLETALLILHDWACAITFPQEEIDKERGVITEEWRLRQGLQGRINDNLNSFLLKDSDFEERLPIGDMDIIANINRDRIVDFYKKWYRPDLMSVVAVGDIDTEILENAIQKTMSVIPANKEKINHQIYRTPVKEEKDILVMKDAEQKYSLVNIFTQEADFAPRATEEDYRALLAQEIGAWVFNQRLSEITNSADAPWLDAGIGESEYTNYTIFSYLGVVPKTGMFTQAMQTFFDEYDRFMAFGVTQREVDRIKQAILAEAEQELNNKDKINSSNHADKLDMYSLVNKVVISQEDAYRITKENLPKITLEEINKECQKLIFNRGTLMFVLAPDTADDIPDEDGLMALWTEYSNPEIIAYTDDVEDENLMEIPSGKAKITSQNHIAELDVNEYILENGIRIITKKTDFEANRIIMNASSKGGHFLVADKDIPSSTICLNYAILSGLNGMTYNQLIKKITAKQVSLGFNINETSEFFNGSCKCEDTDILLQLLNLMFTKTQFNEEGWQIAMNNEIQMAQSHGLQPNDVFNDKIREILYGNEIRYAPNDMNYAQKMDAKAAEIVYKTRFANPADFTFIFTGDFNEAQLLDLCCTYLGTMPTTKDREETVYKYWDFPKGITSATVNKGQDEQGQVFIGFGGNLPAAKDIEESFYDSEMVSQLVSLLDICLREVIREDKSGSYGIGVNGYTDGYPERFYRFNINFGCEPKREQELTEEVIALIKQLQSEPVSDIYIEKLQEGYRRAIETNLRNNNWWINRINAELVFNYEPLWVTSGKEKIASWITPEVLQSLMNKYFNTENYVSVFLQPENK